MTMKMTKKTKPKSEPTSASLLISSRYSKLKVRERWNKKRVDRMCKFLNITRYELEVLIGSKVERVDVGKKLNMSTCIILTLMEATYLSHYAKDVISDLFDFS